MAEQKTQPTAASVEKFLASIKDETRREDCRWLVAMMKRITRAEPRMWGKSMVGFGEYSYTYASGHSGHWFLTGFAPRKTDITLYVMAGLDRYQPLLTKLGKHSHRKSCLYVKRLADVDRAVLARLITAALKDLKATVAARKREAGAARTARGGASRRNAS
jgi:hypothetical protein